MIEKITDFVKRETVLSVAALLAVISAFFVHPGKEYLDYIDFRVLILLFCLMVVVAGLKNIGVFQKVGRALVERADSTRKLTVIMTSLSFFSSMFITNDVALITFVPFTILILNMVDKEEKIIKVIVLETIAANLGSMLLPIGNPQNLYLYALSGMNFTEFIKVIIPYWAVSLVMLCIFAVTDKNETFTYKDSSEEIIAIDKKKMTVYIILFFLCIGVVMKLITPLVLLLIVLITVIFVDKNLLKDADYNLLITFVCFFIFIGNIKNMGTIAELLQQWISGRELGMGILTSQVISNVPAAILLSGFTENIKTVLIGVNIGGLGTLVASLASLISFKLYVKDPQSKKGRYFITFTIYNFIFLVVLYLLAVFIQ